MPELAFGDWVIIAICAVLVGIAKTGVPGIGILAVPVMAFVLPARNSVGALLGLLILADIFAAAYYHRSAKWRHIFRVLPAAMAGIVAGYYGMKFIEDEQLKPVIGAVVLVMLGINYWRSRGAVQEQQVPTNWWFCLGMGFLAGVTTIMANAAGPVMVIYLLAMRLPKTEFVGTGAWYFFIVNWLKVPFMANLELMTWESVRLNLVMLPFIAIGAALGILILKKIPERLFAVVVQVLAAAAAAKLLF